MTVGERPTADGDDGQLRDNSPGLCANSDMAASNDVDGDSVGLAICFWCGTATENAAYAQLGGL